MGGFASCMPEESEVRRPGVTADGLPMRGTRIHQHHAAAVSAHSHHQQTLQQDDSNTALPARVLRERHAQQSDLHTHSLAVGGHDFHANARICVAATPNGKDKEKAAFRFYCPICMMHFKEIYKSACCSNYVCVPCALSHIEQRLSLPFTPARLPIGPITAVCCPSCNTENVSFLPVQLDTANGEKPRNYSESPLTKDLLADVTRKQLHIGPTGTAGEDKENAPVSRAGTFHKKVLNFEDDSMRENSHSRSTRQPSTAHTAAVLSTSRLPAFPDLVVSSMDALPPSIVSFQQTVANHPLEPQLEDDDELPSILPALPSDDLPTLDGDGQILEQQCVIQVIPATPRLAST